MKIIANQIVINEFVLNKVRKLGLNEREIENLAILHWFISFMYEKRRAYIPDGIKYVNISKQDFLRVLPKNSSKNSKGYAQLKDIAVKKLKTIEENRNYSSYEKNPYTKSYRLSGRKSLDDIVLLEIKDPKNLERLNKLFRSEVSDDPVCKKAKETADSCTISEKAFDFIKAQDDWEVDKKSQAYFQIYSLNLQNNYSKRYTNCHRMGTNITNLYNDLLPFLQFNDEPVSIKELDIKGQLPLLLSLGLMKVTDKTSDIKKFIAMNMTDDFYKEFENEMKIYGKSRDEIKVDFYKHILNVESKGDLNKLFRKKFPMVMKIIEKSIEKHGTNMNVILMRKEAKLNIDTILKRLQKMHPDKFIQPKHDAILCQADIIDDVERVIQEEYQNAYNFKMKKDINYRITSISEHVTNLTSNERSNSDHQIIPDEDTSQVSEEPRKPDDDQEGIDEGDNQDETIDDEIASTNDEVDEWIEDDEEIELTEEEELEWARLKEEVWKELQKEKEEKEEKERKEQEMFIKLHRNSKKEMLSWN